MKAKPRIRPHQTSLLVAGVLTFVALLVPVVQKFLLPLEYLNTHLHELSHAVMAILTGAQVEKIVVNANGSGVTPVLGGNLLVIASSGYLGASLFGAGMIYAGRTEKGARTILMALGVLLSFSMIVWVRGDIVGVTAGIFWAIGLGLIALLLKGTSLSFCAQFLGIQQCLNAVRSLITLVVVSRATEVHSDASILFDASGIHPLIWSVGWTVFSLGLMGWTLQKSWRTVRP